MTGVALKKIPFELKLGSFITVNLILEKFTGPKFKNLFIRGWVEGQRRVSPTEPTLGQCVGEGEAQSERAEKENPGKLRQNDGDADGRAERGW